MVVFVILHYQVYEETINCVSSILDNVDGNKRVVIVDNASPNNSGKKLKDYFKSNCFVDVMLLEKNYGFAKGNNIGYRYAIEKFHPDFIVVMNNDMEIKQRDFIDKIHEEYANSKFYILGPDIYSTKGEYHQNPQKKSVPNQRELNKKYRQIHFKAKYPLFIYIKWFIKKIFNKKNKKVIRDRNKINHVVYNPFLHGSCYIFSELFISKHCYECFFDKTFMYMEAEILFYQAKRNNELMVYSPSLTVYHHEDVSTDFEFQGYSKSLFSVQCLDQSMKAFLDLMDEDNESKIK